MKFIVFIFLICTLYYCNGYKILLLFPVPVRSMNLLGEGYVKHLLKAGHEVTYITAFPIKNKPDNNFRQIDVSHNQAFFSGVEMMNLTNVMKGQIPVNDIQEFQEMALQIAIMTFENEQIQRFLQDPNERFDIILIDLYETEIYSGLSVLYNCPLIWAYSMGVHWNVLRLIDEPTSAAYTADYLSANVPPLNFVQRIEELWLQLKATTLKRFVISPREEATYDKIFKPLLAQRGRSILPRYEDVIYNASLIFINEYSSFGNIPSTPQNLKFIAGLNIETPTKPLSKELQTLMDNARHGVIYFSLGSTWKSKDIPDSVTKGLLKVFGELKQTVIWKYEAELTNVPENVYIIKWAPQHSILAHPNCLFFITHGGLMSSTEAVHFGVPIIGLPIFFDQFININKAVARGYAIKVDLTFDLPHNLKTAVAIMLSDDKYKRKVKELSLVYHDRVASPAAEMVHWVEHVVRTRGAPHLRSPALHVPLYQKMYLDLIFVVLVVLVTLKICLKRLLFSSKKVNAQKKNK